ncbi:putative membrane protein [Emiliania huxleyi virus 164]|nr:putative membrane protein [Emiliania huxleyi virus 164]
MPHHVELLIQFDFMKIDSWDNEDAILTVDGVEVWRKTYDGSGTELCGNGNRAEIYDAGIRVQFTHTSDTAALVFSTTLSSAASDESWGIQNVVVNLLTDEYNTCDQWCKLEGLCTNDYHYIMVLGVRKYVYCIFDANSRGIDVMDTTGLTTKNNLHPNSCPEGMNIWVPRSNSFVQTLETSLSYRPKTVGIYGIATGCGGCSSNAMNSDNAAQAAHWKAVSPIRTPWFMRAVPYQEPNGDYTAGDWLHISTTVSNFDADGYYFNDRTDGYPESRYYCSTNSYELDYPANLPTGVNAWYKQGTMNLDSPTWKLLHTNGYCSNGYYAGDAEYTGLTLEGCAEICASEPQCGFFYWRDSGITCSRYDTRTCPFAAAPVGNTGSTYAKQYMWADATGNGNTAMIGGSDASVVDTLTLTPGENGAWLPMTVLRGTTTTTVDFGPVIDSDFTICSLTRHTWGFEQTYI